MNPEPVPTAGDHSFTPEPNIIILLTNHQQFPCPALPPTWPIPPSLPGPQKTQEVLLPAMLLPHWCFCSPTNPDASSCAPLSQKLGVISSSFNAIDLSVSSHSHCHKLKCHRCILIHLPSLLPSSLLPLFSLSFS